MMLNLLDMHLLFTAGAVAVAGYLCVTKRDSVPEWFIAATLYGKVAQTNKKICCLKSFSVPKRWFLHIYQFGVLIFTFCTLIMVRSYIFGITPPIWLLHLLDFLVPYRYSKVTATSVLLVQSLVTCHVFRRCYECMFVSVYSSATMQIWHYLTGYFYYCAMQLSVLSNAPGFLTGSSAVPVFSLEKITWNSILGTIVFLWAFYVQLTTHLRMASWRKDSKGSVVSLKHKVPKGGMFEYVSCPHYMAEVLLYSALTLILGAPNTSWWLVLAWNWTNQILLAFVNHNWYKKNFIAYPRNRRVIFPFIL